MRELEEKRINKEMANIRKKFKGITDANQLQSQILTTEILKDGNLDGYQKKKCVL